MSIIVSDTSPISALFRLERLDILPELYGEVLIPPAVYGELLNLAAFGHDLTPLTAAEWLRVVVPANQVLLNHLRQDLDAGEAEAITLAMETQDSLLIMDEKKGRKIAHELNLPMLGVLGVLLEAKEAGLVDLLKPLLASMQEIGFRISPSLLELVLQQAGE